MTWEDYDDRLRKLAKINPDFAGINTNPDGTLVISIRSQFLHEEKRGEIVIHNNYFEMKRKAGFEWISGLKDLFGEERFKQKSEYKLGVLGQIIVSEERKLATRTVTYSFAELYDWYRSARLEILAIDHVVAADIDEVSNKILLYSDAPASEIFNNRLNKLMQDMSIPEDAYGVILSDAIVSNASLRDKASTMKGGLQIFRVASSTGYSICTMGFITSIGGVRGFFTNAHCTATFGEVDDGTKFYQGDYNGSYVSVGVPTLESQSVAPCGYTSIPCVYTNAAFVPFPSNISSAESILKTDNINTGSLKIKQGQNRHGVHYIIQKI
jgi:hypothetical protein